MLGPNELGNDGIQYILICILDIPYNTNYLSNICHAVLVLRELSRKVSGRPKTSSFRSTLIKLWQYVGLRVLENSYQIEHKLSALGLLLK
jgi:hypothetical protein